MTTWTIGWWTAAERERAAAAVSAALEAWRGQWGGTLNVIDTDLLGPEPASGNEPAAAWLRLTGHGDRDGVWLTHPDTAARALGLAFFDDARNLQSLSRHGGSLSLAVARQAAQALAAALLAHFDWRSTEDAAACTLPDGVARGGLMLRLSVAGAPLALVLSAGVARAVSGRGGAEAMAPLRPLPEVIGERTVMLNVALRAVRLDIGSLCSLARGDVIALDHKLDEPVALLAGDGSPVADAHLVKMGQFKAIKFGRASP